MSWTEAIAALVFAGILCGVVASIVGIRRERRSEQESFDARWRALAEKVQKENEDRCKS